MSNPRPSNDGWRSCPPGTLTGLATGLRKAEQRKQRLRIVGGVATLLLMFTAGAWYSNRYGTLPDDYPYGGISCMEVKDSLPQMMNGTASPELVAKIRTHLAECPRCAELARKMQEQSHAGRQRTSPRNKLRAQVLLANDVNRFIP
jgi:hypothetical protein